MVHKTPARPPGSKTDLERMPEQFTRDLIAKLRGERVTIDAAGERQLGLSLDAAASSLKRADLLPLLSQHVDSIVAGLKKHRQLDVKTLCAAIGESQGHTEETFVEDMGLTASFVNQAGFQQQTIHAIKNHFKWNKPSFVHDVISVTKRANGHLYPPPTFDATGPWVVGLGNAYCKAALQDSFHNALADTIPEVAAVMQRTKPTTPGILNSPKNFCLVLDAAARICIADENQAVKALNNMGDILAGVTSPNLNAQTIEKAMYEYRTAQEIELKKRSEQAAIRGFMASRGSLTSGRSYQETLNLITTVPVAEMAYAIADVFGDSTKTLETLVDRFMQERQLPDRCAGYAAYVNSKPASRDGRIDALLTVSPESKVEIFAHALSRIEREQNGEERRYSPAEKPIQYVMEKIANPMALDSNERKQIEIHASECAKTNEHSTYVSVNRIQYYPGEPEPSHIVRMRRRLTYEGAFNT